MENLHTVVRYIFVGIVEIYENNPIYLLRRSDGMWEKKKIEEEQWNKLISC